MVDQRRIEMLDGDFDNIGRVDRADDARPVKCTLAVLDTGGLEVRNDGEVLPDLALQTRLGELFAQDRVGLSDRFETVSCDRAGAADTKTRARERLAFYHVLRQTERLADHADFVLEQDADRLDQLKVEIFRQTARIVVRLDAGFALENIRPDGALRQEFDAVQLARFLGKDFDELAAR